MVTAKVDRQGRPSTSGATGTIGATGSTGATTAVAANTGATGTTTTTMPLGIPGNWTLRFSDSFAGSSLDANAWTPGWFGSTITNPVNSSELTCYDAKQVAVSGGMLNLTAIAKRQTAPNGKTYAYSSGLISSNGKYQFTYGVMEARIYLPATNGRIANWPAFWADGTGLWPTTGELDVMEGLDGAAAYHFHSTLGGPGADVSGDYTGWHTYAADWQPGRVDYYYDGKNVGSITTGITSSPMYLVLNYGIGTGTAPVVPATMQVNYVRVWQ